MSNKLTGIFTLKSPLSHIGESLSTISYLVQEPILQPDRTISEVFCYSGNAWRGQLRDLAAAHMLEELDMQVSLDSFHLLFSGGKIGGDQKVDIEKLKGIRKAVPMLALFGGGIGNSIMPGLMRVGNCYPICKEALPVLPNVFHEMDELESYSDMTFEKEFSRVDDAKSERLSKYRAETEDQEEKKSKKKNSKVKDQMRMTSELVCAGTRLYLYIDLLDDSPVYLGVLLSALTKFSDSPFIGGQNNKGHGLVELNYELNGEKFYSLKGNTAELSNFAVQTLDDYNELLIEKKDSIQEILK